MIPISLIFAADSMQLIGFVEVTIRKLWKTLSIWKKSQGNKKCLTKEIPCDILGSTMRETTTKHKGEHAEKKKSQAIKKCLTK
jgi:hypothetical protein